MSKFRLQMPDTKEETKSILVALARISGIPKEPSSLEHYYKVVIDYGNRLYTTQTIEEELEISNEQIEQELQASIDFLISPFKKIIKIIKGGKK